MKVLVTGGAGFIGSAVCRLLVAHEGVATLNLDKLTYAANSNSCQSIEFYPNYHFQRGDICDRALLQKVFRDFCPTAVIHLAAESHVDRSITEAGDFVQTNIVGTYSLLDAARTYWSQLDGAARADFRIVHVSTDEVYGSLGPAGRFRETTAYNPSSPYSASKAASDHLALAWYNTYGLPVIVSNCSNNYGPFQFPEKLIPLMILNALESRALPVYGDGTNVRDWLYVEDHARALVDLLKHGRPGEKYNIGGHNEHTNQEVVEQICRVLDERLPEGRPHARLITHVADRPGHDLRYAIDPSKIMREIGWKPRENFATGIERTVDWYLENEAWWRPLRHGVYAGERLGLIAGAARPRAGAGLEGRS